MNLLRPIRLWTAAAAVAVVLGACYDLDVTNPNAPDADSAIPDAEAARSLIAAGYQSWHQAVYSYFGPGLALSGVSFQHSSSACGAPYAWLPRTPVANDQDNVWYHRHSEIWDELYATLTPVADGLRWLDEHPVEAAALGEAELARTRALARLVQGVAHGSLALLYDRAFIVDETSDPYALDREPVPYPSVMAAALDYLDDAATTAARTDGTLPAAWLSVPVDADRLARIARSLAARYRAAVARTPDERAAVDWTAVLADVDAGITESWIMDMDYHEGWYNAVIDYGTYPGWAMDPYFIIGMADQSGSYQRWLRTPLDDRTPIPDSNGDGDPELILIVTPDTRFARGESMAEQAANPGSIYVIPEWGIRNVWYRPDRGTWRWSWYWHIDTAEYTFWNDFHWPEIPLAEMRLLKAEGLLRSGDRAGAAALINVSRTAAGLRPTDAAGTNDDCVPRLPDGSCGGLMEMLKWEKRLETHMQGLFGAPWYFDGRGWGDLHAGTFLQFPIPCGELGLMGMTCYTFGGQGDATAPGSVYRWEDEVPGTTLLRDHC